MLITTRYLYNNETVINLHDGSSSRVWNGNMYDRQLKIYKGISNPLRFVIKNQDNKPVNILNKTITFILMDKENHMSLLERDGIVIDGSKGISEVKILDTDLLNINAKYYNYAVKVIDAEGDESLLYNDLAFNINGSVEILDHVYPTFVESQSSFISAFTTDSEILPDTTTHTRHVSTYFDSSSSLHTVQLYFTNFTGIVNIQGTMAQISPLAEEDWSDIVVNGESSKDIIFTDKNGTTGYTFSGVYQKVRVKFRFTSGVLGAASGPLIEAGITAGNKNSAIVSGTNTGPAFVIGESFWIDTTLVTMTGTTATTFAADVNAFDFENLSSSVADNGSVQFNYTGGSSYDLSFSGVDKILYRS